MKVWGLVLIIAVGAGAYYFQKPTPAPPMNPGYSLHSGMKFLQAFPTHPQTPLRTIRSSYALSRKGTFFAQSWPGQVKVFDRQSYTVALSIEVKKAPSGIHFSPMSNHLLLVWYSRKRHSTAMELYELDTTPNASSAKKVASFRLNGKQPVLGWAHSNGFFFAKSEEQYFTYPEDTSISRTISSMSGPLHKYLFWLGANYKLVFPRAMNSADISEDRRSIADAGWRDGGTRVRLSSIEQRKVLVENSWKGPKYPLSFIRAFNDGTVLLPVTDGNQRRLVRWEPKTNAHETLVELQPGTRLFDVQLHEELNLISALVDRPKDGKTEQTLTFFSYNP